MSKQEYSIPSLAMQVPDETAAYLLMEKLRWEGRPVCSHCGSVAAHYFLTPKDNAGRKTRTGRTTQRRVWKCKDCRKQFTVLTGTIFHGTKIPLRTWLFVIFEMCASKNGVAAREIERKYDVTAKSAWFMVHRIREAMKRDPLAGLLAGTVVSDETWIGGNPANRHGGGHGRGTTDKVAVVALVNKETGEVRSQVVRDVNRRTIDRIMREEVDIANTVLHTDASVIYPSIGKEFISHGSVNHGAGEYVRDGISTNVAEGYFSQLKRSLDGTHHAVSREHLTRYLGEFDFRYSTRNVDDSTRMWLLMGATGGRRLTYKPLTQS